MEVILIFLNKVDNWHNYFCPDMDIFKKILQLKNQDMPNLIRENLVFA